MRRMPTFNLTAIEYSDTRHEVAKKKKYGTSILLTQPLNLYCSTWKTKKPSPASAHTGQ
jgi:hypothetical protein